MAAKPGLTCRCSACFLAANATPSAVLRQWKVDAEAINQPDTPDYKAFIFLVQAQWSIDLAITLAEAAEAAEAEET